MIQLQICISLALIWILFFWLYRDYRLDLLRERLFAIRDELFEMGVSGELPFNSRAYTILRGTINGTIQCGHRFNICEILAFGAIVNTADGDRFADQYRAEWEEACNDLPKETRDKLNEFRTRMHMQLFEQVLFTSAILMFTTISIVLFFAFVALKRITSRVMRRLLSFEAMSRLSDRYDSAAFLHAVA